jgi:hypothetical protein
MNVQANPIKEKSIVDISTAMPALDTAEIG